MKRQLQRLPLKVNERYLGKKLTCHPVSCAERAVPGLQGRSGAVDVFMMLCRHGCYAALACC